jgi:hypothetical protein
MKKWKFPFNILRDENRSHSVSFNFSFQSPFNNRHHVTQISVLFKSNLFEFSSSSGPFAVLMTYLSELHGLKYRSRVMLSTGICFSLAAILLPSLGLIIIPNPNMNLTLIEGILGKWFEFRGKLKIKCQNYSLVFLHVDFI